MRAPGQGVGRAFDLSPFQVFSLVYAAAIMLEMMERWRDVPATLVMLALTLLLIWRTNLLTFALLLLASNTYFILFKFPEVANHVNLTIFSNSAILLVMAVQKLRNPRADKDEMFLGMQPTLRLLIIATFSVAGFHKFNTDFVDPEVSCAGWFAGGVFRALGVDFLGLGIPAVIPVAGVMLFATASLSRGSGRLHWPRVDWRGVAAPVVAILAMAVLVLSIVGTDRITDSRDALVFGIAIMVLSWQLVEGPLLLIKRYQWVALAFSIIIHAVIAMFMVVDFQAIAVALLVTFVPPEVWTAWRNRSRIDMAGITINRGALYLYINLFAGLLMLVHFHFVPFMNPPYVIGGILFNISLLVLLWPIVADLFSPDRSWRWTGVPVLHPAAPRFSYMLPVLLVAFGLTSHFGLRTAGNFSMFSNLRTEGVVSNHLILSNNPFKFWGYQEDVVEIVEFDRVSARIGHQYSLDEGLMLPMVEFRKLLYLWREAGIPVPMTLRYRGENVVSNDIANEPGWVVDRWNWEMRLLDFRVIQPDNPNRCRW